MAVKTSCLVLWRFHLAQLRSVSVRFIYFGYRPISSVTITTNDGWHRYVCIWQFHQGLSTDADANPVHFSNFMIWNGWNRVKFTQPLVHKNRENFQFQNRGFGRLRFLIKTAVSVSVRFPSQHYPAHETLRSAPQQGQYQCWIKTWSGCATAQGPLPILGLHQTKKKIGLVFIVINID